MSFLNGLTWDCSSGNLLDSLPLEVLYETLIYLSLSEIGNVSQASVSMRNKIASWAESRSCLVRVFGLDRDGALERCTLGDSAAENQEAVFNLLRIDSTHPLHGFAMLHKKITCLMSTPKRVQITLRNFERVVVLHSDSLKDVSKDWRSTLYNVEFFTVIHAFTRGWDESEFSFLLSSIDEKFSLTSNLTTFFKSNRRSDVCVTTEMQLRVVLRCLTWDFAGSDYSLRASWILSILDKFAKDSASKQAMLFYLAFGPPCHEGLNHFDRSGSVTRAQQTVMNEITNHADWEYFLEMVPDDFHEGKECFFTMAQAVCCCTSSNETWKYEMLDDVLDELFTIPSRWKRENVAGFLLFCSEMLILSYLKTKVDREEDGALREVARLIFDMIVMSYRFENELSSKKGIGKIFDIMFKYPEPEIQDKLQNYFLEELFGEMEKRELETEVDEYNEIVSSVLVHISSKSFDKAADEYATEE